MKLFWLLWLACGVVAWMGAAVKISGDETDPFGPELGNWDPREGIETLLLSIVLGPIALAAVLRAIDK